MKENLYFRDIFERFIGEMCLAFSFFGGYFVYLFCRQVLGIDGIFNAIRLGKYL